MRQAFSIVLFAAGALTLLTTYAEAHGGNYRGPPDVVPPGPGGGGGGRGGPGPTTGGPAEPSAPRPGGPTAPGTGGVPGPTTPGSGPSGGGATAPVTGGSAPPETDVTTWDVWWEFNKDSFLSLKDAVDAGGPITGDEFFHLGNTRRATERGMRPTRAEALVVLPTLKKAIDSGDNRDIASATMIAMAKIGQDHPDFTLRSVFEPRLRRGDQEVRETAALALGIAGQVSQGELQLLAGLALENAEGRAAAGGSVNVRTRSFALYA